MMHDVIIDGVNIRQKFRAYLQDGAYGPVLQWPSTKQVKQNEWQEEDGTEPDLSDIKLDTRSLVIPFILKGYADEITAFYKFFGEKPSREFQFSALGQKKKAIQRYREAYEKAVTQMWKEVDNSTVAAMQEGTAKKLAQIHNEEKQAIAAIDEEQDELEKAAKKAGKTVSQETYPEDANVPGPYIERSEVSVEDPMNAEDGSNWTYTHSCLKPVSGGKIVKWGKFTATEGTGADAGKYTIAAAQGYDFAAATQLQPSGSGSGSGSGSA